MKLRKNGQQVGHRYIDGLCDKDAPFPPVKWRAGADYDDVVDDDSDWLNYEFVMVRLELFALVDQVAQHQGETPADFIREAIRDRLKQLVEQEEKDVVSGS